jgi:hypothetical protein
MMTAMVGWLTEDSEHRVVVLRRLREDLQHIPMLDDLAVLVEPEDINTSVRGVTRPSLMTMEHDEVILCNRPLKLGPLAGIFSSHAIEVVDERLLPISHMRVVLHVDVTGIPFNGLSRAIPVEHQVVEGHGIVLVLFESIGHGAIISSTSSHPYPVRDQFGLLTT